MSTDDFQGELRGEAATAFAAKYLRKVGSDSKTWEVFYVDDRSGETWVMDYPESEQHGGGSPRLVKRRP